MVDPIRFPTEMTMPPHRQVEIATIIILPIVGRPPEPGAKQGRIVKINVGPKLPGRKR